MKAFFNCVAIILERKNVDISFSFSNEQEVGIGLESNDCVVGGVGLLEVVFFAEKMNVSVPLFDYEKFILVGLRNTADATDPCFELCASVFCYSLIVPDLKCGVHGFGNDSSNVE